MAYKIAFIGSRKLKESSYPQDYQIFYNLALLAATNGVIMRSGGAEGADLCAETAYFEASKENPEVLKLVEIFVPWRSFNASNPLHKHYSKSLPGVEEEECLLTVMNESHYLNLSNGAALLHLRNCKEILGDNLDSPVDVVICFTVNRKVVGGTATGIKLAINSGIPVYNIYGATEEEVRFLEAMIRRMKGTE